MFKSMAIKRNSVRSCKCLVIVLHTHGIQHLTYIVDRIEMVLD